MSENTKIEWCDHTFNPWEGCQKVSSGCDNCYAEARNIRFGGGQSVNWGPGAPRRLTSDANWAKPLKWNRDADKFFSEHGRRQRVFCSSLADVFDNEVSAQWRYRLLRLIELTPNLDWLILTKRIGNARGMLNQAVRANTAGRENWDNNYFPNVWIGATVVNQGEADRDIPKLLNVPAAVRFLSIEPMLGPVDIDHAMYGSSADRRGISCFGFTDGVGYEACIQWVICGGESGPNARPMHPDWARSLRDQCETANVPFLFKQWGEWLPRSYCYHKFADGTALAELDPGASKWQIFRMTYQGGNGNALHSQTGSDDVYMQRVGKKMAGRLLDGREHNGFPKAKD